jgi:hypothetical protein
VRHAVIVSGFVGQTPVHKEGEFFEFGLLVFAVEFLKRPPHVFNERCNVGRCGFFHRDAQAFTCVAFGIPLDENGTRAVAHNTALAHFGYGALGIHAAAAEAFAWPSERGFTGTTGTTTGLTLRTWSGRRTGRNFIGCIVRAALVGSVRHLYGFYGLWYGTSYGYWYGHNSQQTKEVLRVTGSFDCLL